MFLTLNWSLQNNGKACTSIRYTANYKSQPLWIISICKALRILPLFDQTRLPHSQITSWIMIGFGFILKTYIKKKEGSFVWNPIPLSKVIPVVTSSQNLETGWLTIISLPSEIYSHFNTCTLRRTQFRRDTFPQLSVYSGLSEAHFSVWLPDAVQPHFSSFLSVVVGYEEEERWLVCFGHPDSVWSHNQIQIGKLYNGWFGVLSLQWRCSISLSSLQWPNSNSSSSNIKP